jgi:hypothetical protein
MLKVVIGHSDDPSSQGAIEDVLEQCRQNLGEIVPKAGILLNAIDFDHAAILKEIDRVFPGLDLIGCTTDGEMSSVLGFQQDSLILMLFCSDDVGIEVGIGHEASKDPIAAAHQAVQQANPNQDVPKLCILLPASYITDGTTTNGELILQGLKQALGEKVPIIGGTAGDQYRFKNTSQFFHTEVLNDTLPILVFYGDILFSYGTGCGWEPLGAASVITKSEGTTLYEIDGKPALDFYEHYLGDRPPTAENPLAVYERNSDSADLPLRYYMRVPNLCDRANGSVTFLGNVPEQSTIKMTDINRDEVIAASKTSFQTALDNYPGTEPEAVLIFSCCCRRWLLGTRANQEYQLVRSTVAPNIPIAGFYTYGEFAPLESGGETYYHQETFVTLLLGTK